MAKILLVDDNEDIRRLCGHLLRKQGHDVLLALDGEDALRHATRDNPDLVIMDINLPGENGLTAMGRLLKRRRVPVIIFTAFPTYKQEMLSWAADDFVVKSPDLAELKHAVARILERSQN
ncbi:response regulator [bacterium]|nr:response regulator [candidate division CSSED10-310 bacterium]